MADIFQSTLWVMGLILTIFASYYVMVALFSLLPHKKGEAYSPHYKFAFLIAARNEELVIGDLIDSLQKQTYPKELYDIVVIPNNCTDRTKEFALARGALVYECKSVIKSKGDVLHEYFDSILQQDDVYDAFCIIDADNLVHEDFLLEMNRAMSRGAKVGQCYRESKNPYDSVIASCYTIFYYMDNRFLNHARSILNLSALINGSGFFVSAEVIKGHKGWHTTAITEDVEFTIQCAMAGEKIHWIPDAIVYDEQPLTFAQSWDQRIRWSAGLLQCMKLYFKKLMKCAILHRNATCFDLAMFSMVPVIQVLVLVGLIFISLYHLNFAGLAGISKTDFLYQVVLPIVYSYVVTTALALAVIVIERKKIGKMLRGILAFWFFIVSWLPINILCFIKKQTVWLPIKHTRAVKIDDLDIHKE